MVSRKGKQGISRCEPNVGPRTCLHVLGRATMRSRKQVNKMRDEHKGNGHHATAHHVGLAEETSRDGLCNLKRLIGGEGEPGRLGGSNKSIDMSGREGPGAGAQHRQNRSFFSVDLPVSWQGRAQRSGVDRACRSSRSTQPGSPGLGCLVDVLRMEYMSSRRA